jgi:hypothetical protein
LGYLLFAASAAGFLDLEIPFPVFNPFSTQNVTAYVSGLAADGWLRQNGMCTALGDVRK